ncbi:MAG TPA: penicillin-binding protein 2 [Gaiellaceae bacterium]|nr:penicillin-binding protein 2 [Gaiellaceae bacterium]
MNRQLNRLAIFSVILLVALVAATTYWQAWAAGSLQAKQDNAIQRVVQFTIARGLITGNGKSVVFATNKKQKANGQTLYFRRYPEHGLAAQTIGYSTASRAQAGLEQSMNDYLTGANTDLSNAFRRALDSLGGGTVHGNNLELTLRPGVQKLAQAQLGSRCGAVVAMNPHTGAVYVMASSPTYDPNLIDQPGGYAKVLKIKGDCGDGFALLNRATSGLYTPGSTFKIITAAAALDSGALTPDSPFVDPGYCTEYGKKVSNANNPDQTAETYGRVTLAQGFQHSINSVFCNVGKQIGVKKILDYAKKFGFYKTPPLETPAGERSPSGLYKFVNHRSLLDDPKDPNSVDPGRLAFGQSTMLVTPLQMAMVASTVANGGVVPKPYLVQKVVGPDGSTIRDTKPGNLGRAIKPQTAADLTAMMVSVVQGGTGTAAQIPGIQVAGKTGTAESSVPHVYTAWFVCFAPADNPQVAVAVVVEKQANGFGGAVAAPIAKAVLQALLHR